eukprot:5861617-Pyramimonas_sp.AAC.1
MTNHVRSLNEITSVAIELGAEQFDIITKPSCLEDDNMGGVFLSLVQRLRGIGVAAAAQTIGNQEVHR